MCARSSTRCAGGKATVGKSRSKFSLDFLTLAIFQAQEVMFTPISLLVGPLWLHLGLRRSVRAHAEADAVVWAQHRAQPYLACGTRRPLVVAGLSGRGCRGPWLCGARHVGNMGLARLCMLCVCALRQQSAGGREMHTCRRCACSLHDFGGHGQCPARCLFAGARVLPGMGSPIRTQECASWEK